MTKESPSRQSDARLEEVGAWRGATLSRPRDLPKQADPEVVEERKCRKATNPGVPADFLIHPECGCSTSVMEYAAGAAADTTAIVATETGMLHPLREARPDVDFVAANEAASCRFMKMKLQRARLPIERMVAIG